MSTQEPCPWPGVQPGADPARIWGVKEGSWQMNYRAGGKPQLCPRLGGSAAVLPHVEGTTRSGREGRRGWQEGWDHAVCQHRSRR